MAYVDEKIEEFLQEMKDILTNMTQEEFDDLVGYSLLHRLFLDHDITFYF